MNISAEVVAACAAIAGTTFVFLIWGHTGSRKRPATLAKQLNNYNATAAGLLLGVMISAWAGMLSGALVGEGLPAASAQPGLVAILIFAVAWLVVEGIHMVYAMLRYRSTTDEEPNQQHQHQKAETSNQCGD